MKMNRRVFYTLLMAAMSGLAACEQNDAIHEVTEPVASQSLLDGNWYVETLQRANALTGDITYVTTTPITYEGSVLRFGPHILVVPVFAVRQPTYFSATLRAGSAIKVDLRAWQPNGTEVTKFMVPLILRLDYSDAANTDKEELIAVYYHKPSGGLEKMPSWVSKDAKKVSALLPHFSDYSGGFPRNDSTVNP